MGKGVQRRGYQPPAERPGVALDGPIADGVAALTRAVAVWRALEPSLDKFVPYLAEVIEEGKEAGVWFSRKTGKPVTEGEWAREVAGDLATLLERISRAAVNLTKVVDNNVRLRELLTGGEVAPDVADMDDVALQDILVETVLARGLWRLIRKRAEERGVVLEAEVVADAPLAIEEVKK